MRALRALPLVLAATACGGSGGGAAPDLAGTWSRTITTPETWAFADDGTFTFDAEGEHSDGTWVVEGGTVVMNAMNDGDASPYRNRYSFAIDGDALVLFALIADGAHEDVVGTWIETFVVERLTAEGALDRAIGSTGTYVLAADGTATLDQVWADGAPTDHYDGTWTTEGDELVIDAGAIPSRVRRVGADALGWDEPYLRQP